MAICCVNILLLLYKQVQKRKRKRRERQVIVGLNKPNYYSRSTIEPYHSHFLCIEKKKKRFTHACTQHIILMGFLLGKFSALGFFFFFGGGLNIGLKILFLVCVSFKISLVTN